MTVPIIDATTEKYNQVLLRAILTDLSDRWQPFSACTGGAEEKTS
jgi:hypothetical protein